MKRFILICLLAGLFSGFVFGQAEKEEKTTMNPALLVIDVQNKYLPMMSEEDQELALEMMNWAIYVFRYYDLPIIRVYHTSPEWGPEPGTEEFEFHDSLKVVESDIQIIKTYASSFNKTELNDILKEKEVNTLFICGLSSVGCVLSTYLDAANYDYKAFMIKDALLSHKAEYTKQVENIFDALDLNTVNYMIEISR